MEELSGKWHCLRNHSSEGLKESDKLHEPIYTPSTKAEIGDHDENISFEQSIDHLEKYFPGRGRELAEKLRDNTIALYKKCAEYALSKGIIIADTKFEFGLDEDGNMVIGDEMLTPDSSVSGRQKDMNQAMDSLLSTNSLHVTG